MATFPPWTRACTALQRLLRLRQPRYHHRQRLTLRDHLALERTHLGNERTLLSYIRSSIYVMIGGRALIQLKGNGNLRYIGYFASFRCALSLVTGIYRFRRLRSQLDRYYRIPRTLEEIQDRKDDGA